MKTTINVGGRAVQVDHEPTWTGSATVRWKLGTVEERVELPGWLALLLVDGADAADVAAQREHRRIGREAAGRAANALEACFRRGHGRVDPELREEIEKAIDDIAEAAVARLRALSLPTDPTEGARS